MARIRTVKPELSSHEGLYDLEVETGLPIRFAWCMLFTVADREGRFKWLPRTLKAQILPHDEIEFSRVLDAWATRAFVVKYRVKDAWFGWIPTFRKHQMINNRESLSELPGIDEAEEVLGQSNHEDEDACRTREGRDSDACRTREVHALVEGKGREGKEEEGTPTGAVEETEGELLANGSGGDHERKRQPVIPRGSRIPDDFVPDATYASAQLSDLDVEAEAAKFCDYWRARPGKEALKLDWPATWRTWIRNAKERGRYARKSPGLLTPLREEPRFR